MRSRPPRSLRVRGRGIGRAMLDHLLAVARECGFERVSLETGSMEAFAPARLLYLSAGFAPCEPFGDYRPSTNTVYMTLRISGQAMQSSRSLPPATNLRPRVLSRCARMRHRHQAVRPPAKPQAVVCPDWRAYGRSPRVFGSTEPKLNGLENHFGGLNLRRGFESLPLRHLLDVRTLDRGVRTSSRDPRLQNATGLTSATLNQNGPCAPIARQSERGSGGLSGLQRQATDRERDRL